MREHPPAHAASLVPRLTALAYATASVRVRRDRGTVRRHGVPILYAVSVPRAVPYREDGARFVALTPSAERRAMFRGAGVDMLMPSKAVGNSVPAAVRAVRSASP